MKKFLNGFNCLYSDEEKISPWRESGCVKQSELQPQERVKKAAFTLVETLIVIVVLGIIATLTIPALVNKNKESVAKTKVRKAMAAYESALNKMIIENDLKDNGPLKDWAGNLDNGCANSTNYFKKVQDVNGCTFRTSDGIWWNISDIERPLIAFNQDNLTIDKANAANDYSAFVLVGRFGTDGSLRVDDLAYETANSIDDAYGNASKAQVEKLYNLLGLKSSSAGDGNQSPFAACFAENAETCVVNGLEYKKITLTNESEEYCIWDEEDNAVCDYISNSIMGDYYIAIENILDNYEEQAFNYDGSTCQYCQDENIGDYYNAAKRHCESAGGRLAKIAEIKSLAKQGKLSSDRYSWYWTNEKAFIDRAYLVYADGEIDDMWGDDMYTDDGLVICVGNK